MTCHDNRDLLCEQLQWYSGRPNAGDKVQEIHDISRMALFCICNNTDCDYHAIDVQCVTIQTTQDQYHTHHHCGTEQSIVRVMGGRTKGFPLPRHTIP